MAILLLSAFAAMAEGQGTMGSGMGMMGGGMARHHQSMMSGSPNRIAC
jgi:hypothetical protein